LFFKGGKILESKRSEEEEVQDSKQPPHQGTHTAKEREKKINAKREKTAGKGTEGRGLQRGERNEEKKRRSGGIIHDTTTEREADWATSIVGG